MITRCLTTCGPARAWREQGWHSDGMATAESARTRLADLLERPPPSPARIHHRRQHADRVGARALDPLIRALEPAEEIAPADDNRDLHASVSAAALRSPAMR